MLHVRALESRIFFDIRMLSKATSQWNRRAYSQNTWNAHLLLLDDYCRQQFKEGRWISLVVRKHLNLSLHTCRSQERKGFSLIWPDSPHKINIYRISKLRQVRNLEAISVGGYSWGRRKLFRGSPNGQAICRMGLPGQTSSKIEKQRALSKSGWKKPCSKSQIP